MNFLSNIFLYFHSFCLVLPFKLKCILAILYFRTSFCTSILNFVLPSELPFKYNCILPSLLLYFLTSLWTSIHTKRYTSKLPSVLPSFLLYFLLNFLSNIIPHPSCYSSSIPNELPCMVYSLFLYIFKFPSLLNSLSIFLCASNLACSTSSCTSILSSTCDLIIISHQKPLPLAADVSADPLSVSPVKLSFIRFPETRFGL